MAFVAYDSENGQGIREETDNIFHKTATWVSTDVAEVEFVAATTGKRVLVHAITISRDNTGVDFFESGTTVCHVARTSANLNYTLPYNPKGWFATAAGAALNFTPNDSGTDANGAMAVVYSIID